MSANDARLVEQRLARSKAKVRFLLVGRHDGCLLAESNAGTKGCKPARATMRDRTTEGNPRPLRNHQPIAKAAVLSSPRHRFASVFT